MNATIAAELSRLTPAEKIELVQEIWDEIAANPDTLPIPQWHIDELNKRSETQSSDQGRSWEEVRDDILGR
ncbi:addiction module protein [Synoicihabitans lomoniglobus]|uniref:Addiction module protein n=1 Tax=Synoicihabitans lomoniglobus TaxID=2909285 RepID=A0AAE9ZZV9_9BACT|nr:addiction module protein [Opitutaceae bacterium LMO-M01]WED63772.1 addiction module protein [Opitutaceae bacterium LMO-M01]